jgi:23S rRNA (uridine2552-2'-O)-methyltransferase
MARRVLHDRYFRQAKAEGYLARSAYKLIEINEKKRVVRRGARVLDLGCAPGSWLQVASKLVGKGGIVVGADIQETTADFAPNVRVLVADVFEVEPEVLLGAGREKNPGAGASGSRDSRLKTQDSKNPGAGASGFGVGRFDVVLSDMAPSTSGVGDDYASVRLCRRVLELVPSVSAVGGNLVMKVLEGAEYPALLAETRRMYRQVRGFKPKASRDVSREMYIVAHGRTAAGSGEP